MDFVFNRLCPLADNQPRFGLKFVSVKENSVGGERVGRSLSGLTKQQTFYTNRQDSLCISPLN